MVREDEDEDGWMNEKNERENRDKAMEAFRSHSHISPTVDARETL
jgi:hypothetical protein